MKKHFSTALSVILSVCLLLCCVPVASAAQTGEQTSADMNAELTATNSFGELLKGEFDELSDAQAASGGINVFSVEMNGSTATAELETTRDAVLVIGIYSEDGSEMITSGKTVIAAGDESAQLTIPGGIPQYFYLRAFIVDGGTLKPLCRSYECPNYTQEMQEFLSKTTDDFEQNRVLNFDNSTNSNYAVYNENVALIENSDETNVLVSADDVNRVYVIGNADETVLGLSEGQIFSCQKPDGNILIVKVASIEIDDTTVTITGGTLTLEDVFDYVKIEGESDLSTADIDTSTMDPDMWLIEDSDNPEEPAGAKNVEPVGWEVEGEETKTKKMGFERKFDDYGTQISGSLELTATARAKAYITLTQQYLELSLEYNVHTTFDFNLDLGFEFDMPQLSYYPFYTPAIGIVLYLQPTLVVTAKGNMHVEGDLTGSFGMRASMQNGVENISRSPKFTADMTAEVTVYVGLRLTGTAAVELFPVDPDPENHVELASASLWGEFGVQDTASTEAHYTNQPQTALTDSIHDCNLCIKAVLEGKLSGGISARFLDNDKLTLSHDFKGKTFKICDYYYSVTHNQSGYTTCPYIKYLLTVSVVDQNSLPVKGATVYGSYTTNANGAAFIYLPNGEYNISASANGATASASKKIESKADSLVIHLNISGGSGSGSTTPVVNPPLTSGEIAQIAAGKQHAAALMKDGTLYVWGANGSGQVGDGSSVDRPTARKVNGAGNVLPEYSVKQVSLGGSHSAAVTRDGTLYMWGANNYGQLGNGTTYTSLRPIKVMNNVKFVSLGCNHSAAVTTDGSLYVWGANNRGQLGNGNTSDSRIPVKIMDNVKSVNLGETHSSAITNDNSLYTWGDSFKYQLGVGDGGPYHTPVKYPLKIMENIAFADYGLGKSVTWKINNSTWTGIAAHSAAIDTDGALYTWGNNTNGELGDGSLSDRSVPVKVATNIRQVSLGVSHTVAVSKDNALYMWGLNDHGELATTVWSTSSYNRYITPVWKMDNVAQAAAGGAFTVVLTTDGRVLTCGANGSGQLGNGSTSDSSSFNEIAVYDHTPRLTAQNPGKSGESVGANSAKTVTFNGYTANGVYNFYSVKTRTADDVLSNDNLLYISQVTADGDGRISVTYTGTQEYETPFEFVESLDSIDISDVTLNSPEYTYTGSDLYYQPTLTNGGYTLCEGIDYEIGGVYRACDAGEYVAEIRGKGVFTGTRAATFKINTVDLADVDVEGVEAVLYNGEAQTPELTLTDSNRTLAEDTDYTLSWQNNTNPGVGICEILGTGNYTGRKVWLFDIEECDISEHATVQMASRVSYFGRAAEPEITVTVGDRELERDRDYTLTFQNNNGIGIGVAEIKGTGGYRGRIVRWFDITAPDPSELECGDVDGSGEIDISDATAIQLFIAEACELNAEQMQRADVDGDGRVTVKDATAIQRCLAELEPIT